MQTLTWPALALLATAAFSQERPPAFEVVSVKPSAMSNGGYGIGFANLPGGRFLFNMCPLEYIISIAFDMQTFQISGGSRWIHEDRWDIEAKPPTNPAMHKWPAAGPPTPPMQQLHHPGIAPPHPGQKFLGDQFIPTAAVPSSSR